MIITKDNVENYLKGSLFLGTGGGLPYSIHKAIFNKILSKTNEIKITSLNTFAEDDILISAYGVGDPSDIPDNFEELVNVGFKKFQRLTGCDIKGIIPGEIGAEGLAFQIGQYMEIPVVDSDLVGGRAAPEVQLDVFNLFDLDITPILLIAANGENLFLEGEHRANKIEKISRKFFDDNGSSGILIGYKINAKKYKQFAMANTLSQALEIGKLLSKKKLETLKEQFSMDAVYSGVVKDVLLESKGGFLIGEIILENAKVKIKNENIVFISDNEKINAPDLLIFLDKEYNPIHNTQMKSQINKEVILLHKKAQGYWQSKEAEQLWQNLI